MYLVFTAESDPPQSHPFCHCQVSKPLYEVVCKVPEMELRPLSNPLCSLRSRESHLKPTLELLVFRQQCQNTLFKHTRAHPTHLASLHEARPWQRERAGTSQPQTLFCPAALEPLSATSAQLSLPALWFGKLIECCAVIS